MPRSHRAQTSLEAVTKLPQSSNLAIMSICLLTWIIPAKSQPDVRRTPGRRRIWSVEVSAQVSVSHQTTLSTPTGARRLARATGQVREPTHWQWAGGASQEVEAEKERHLPGFKRLLGYPPWSTRQVHLLFYWLDFRCCDRLFLNIGWENRSDNNNKNILHIIHFFWYSCLYNTVQASVGQKGILNTLGFAGKMFAWLWHKLFQTCLILFLFQKGFKAPEG